MYRCAMTRCRRSESSGSHLAMGGVALEVVQELHVSSVVPNREGNRDSGGIAFEPEPSRDRHRRCVRQQGSVLCDELARERDPGHRADSRASQATSAMRRMRDDADVRDPLAPDFVAAERRQRVSMEHPEGRYRARGAAFGPA